MKTMLPRIQTLIFHQYAIPRTFVFLPWLLLCFAGNGYPGDLPSDELVTLRNDLSARLDSLEVEKQQRKRKGESIQELEQDAQRIKDTLTVIRGKLQALPDKPPLDKQSSPFPFGLWNAVSLDALDMVLVGTGGLAVLALTVFFVFTLRHRSMRKKRNISRGRESTFSQSPAGRPVMNTSKAESERLESIRNRIGDIGSSAEKYTPRSIPTSSVEKSAAKPTAQKEHVLQAAREGLSVRDIAKKFNISIDQVNLILRINKP